eukprot:TRINITY_DN12019_c0_g1_i1.p1 TRINITY_DN12019_c0_g1~~TRINITY_DN12019_c0_g1_i1.p1  ORF type:complete len:756 (+),score=151.42 TRINITY_DN12019_c0_g1_i1:55-2322(+)
MSFSIPTTPQPLIVRNRDGSLCAWDSTMAMLQSIRSRFAVLSLAHCDPETRNAIIKLLLDEASNGDSYGSAKSNPIAEILQNPLTPRGVWIYCFPVSSVFLNRMVVLAFQSDNMMDTELLSILMQLSSQLIYVSSPEIRTEDIKRISDATKLIPDSNTSASPSRLTTVIDQHRLFWMNITRKPPGGDRGINTSIPASSIPADGTLEAMLMQSSTAENVRLKFPRRECLSIYPGISGIDPNNLPQEIRSSLLTKLRLCVLSAMAVLDGPGLASKANKLCQQSSLSDRMNSSTTTPSKSPQRAITPKRANTSFGSPASSSKSERLRSVSVALKVYVDGMDRELDGNLPVELSVLAETHNRNYEAAIRSLYEQSSTPDETRDRTAELGDKIARYQDRKLCGGVYFEWWSRNEIASRQYCRALADEMRPEIERISRQYVSDVEGFQEAREGIMSVYRKRGRGPLKLDILRDFVDESDRIYENTCMTSATSKSMREQLNGTNSFNESRTRPHLSIATSVADNPSRRTMRTESPSRDKTERFGDSRTGTSAILFESPRIERRGVPPTPSQLFNTSGLSRPVDTTFAPTSPVRFQRSSPPSRTNETDRFSSIPSVNITSDREKTTTQHLLQSQRTLELELDAQRRRAQDAELLLLQQEERHKQAVEEQIRALTNHFSTLFNVLKRDVLDLQNRVANEPLTEHISTMQSAFHSLAQHCEKTKAVTTNDTLCLLGNIEQMEASFKSLADSLLAGRDHRESSSDS